MREAVVNISNQQEAERAIVALRVVAKQVNDPCAEISAELIDCSQKLLFLKNLTADEKHGLNIKIKNLIFELQKSLLASKRSNFHLAIANDIEGIGKTFSARNVSTAIGLLNCAVTNAFSIYNIERVVGNIKPNYPNPLSHKPQETLIVELNSTMQLRK